MGALDNDRPPDWLIEVVRARFFPVLSRALADGRDRRHEHQSIVIAA
jgi:hypothetical protein